jgi:hypothetical protein
MPILLPSFTLRRASNSGFYFFSLLSGLILRREMINSVTSVPCACCAGRAKPATHGQLVQRRFFLQRTMSQRKKSISNLALVEIEEIEP